jgi:hypothetical protein
MALADGERESLVGALETVAAAARELAETLTQA